MTRVRRNPFEFAALTGAIVVGVALMCGWAWPDAVKDRVPLWFNLTWGLLFVLGAASAVIGSNLRSRANGLLLEQIGLAVLAVTCYVGAGLLGILARETSIRMAAVLLVFLGVACTVQWFRLESTITSIVSRKGRNTRV